VVVVATVVVVVVVVVTGLVVVECFVATGTLLEQAPSERLITANATSTRVFMIATWTTAFTAEEVGPGHGTPPRH
jgi:hypothetical protein